MLLAFLHLMQEAMKMHHLQCELYRPSPSNPGPKSRNISRNVCNGCYEG